jgi:hypothetical protein
MTLPDFTELFELIIAYMNEGGFVMWPLISQS